MEVPVAAGSERAAVADGERIPVAPADRQAILGGRVVVELQLIEPLGDIADVLIAIVVLAEADTPVGEVRLRKLIEQGPADRIEPVRGNDVAWKAARPAGGRAARPGAQRIADEDQPTVGVERL